MADDLLAPWPKAGSAKCTKTMAISVTGDELECIKRLKFWHILGDGLATKAEHKEKWKNVLEQAEQGTLPDDDELDADDDEVGI